mgnify:FL=1
MRVIICFGFLLFVLGCDPSSHQGVPEHFSKPFYGDWGIDLSSRNEDVDPGDDFFEYANGKWIRDNEIPSDRSRHGVWLELRERVEKRLLKIVESEHNPRTTPNSSQKKITDYYSSWMNTKRLNELGLDPLTEDIKRIKSIDSRKDLAGEFGRQYLVAGASPFYASVSINPLNPDEYQLQLGLSGLGLPDRDYYLEDTERFRNIRAKYATYVADVIELVGIEFPDRNAREVLELERQIAIVQWPRADRRDRDKTLNPTSYYDLKTDHPGFDWDNFFKETGVFSLNTLNVNQPDTLKPLIELVNNQSLETWKNYLIFHLVMKNSSLLSEKLDGMNFEFRKVLTGQKEQLPRWKRGIQRVGSRYGLGSLLGKLYVERHFPPSSKEKMIDLVNNLRQAFRNRIEAIDWMTEETKKEAYRKLSSFEPKIGYPENWGDLTAIEIDQAELFLNARRIQNFFQKRDIRKLGKKTDRTEWFMSAHNVNAYYMASFNQIVFPAGILEAPFFDPLADPAVNYGAIGGVIGHEMGHGFDDQGSKYDSTGTKRNWWTSLDRKNFEKKTTLLVQQYDSFEVIPGYHIDGAFTLGENIGDLGGLEIAFEAYKISMQGKEDVILNGLSGAQRFFLAWAQTWRGSSRNEFLVRQLKSDSHSPQKYRVNGVVRNMSSWYEAFGVNSRHELYLPENLRSSIW